MSIYAGKVMIPNVQHNGHGNGGPGVLLKVRPTMDSKFGQQIAIDLCGYDNHKIIS